MKTRQMAMNAMMAAMCAVLGYVSLDLGNLKVTFESLPILLAALLFGPFDGMLVGGMGTLLYQLLRYGISATTVLWILPYVVCGLAAGACSTRRAFSLTQRQTLVLVVGTELLVTVLNTGVLYIDSIVYGYYSAVFLFGSLGPRLILCVGKAAAFGLVLPILVKKLRPVIRPQAIWQGR